MEKKEIPNMPKPELKFRPLKANEIECRVGQVNKGGASVLLYQDARAAQNLLDETVGPYNWQKHYFRDNANCVVAIYDPLKKIWVEKEDVGTVSNTEAEKGLASDSFKRACVAWGVGRELYTAPKMFVPKDRLPHFSDEGGKYKCGDSFEVKEIVHTEDGDIASVTIAITYFGKEQGTVTFKNGSTVASAPKKEQTESGKPSEDELTTALGKAYALAPSAGTSVDGVNDWIRNKYKREAAELTLEEIRAVIAALEKQAAKKSA